jgi:hypothetical protein
MPLFGSPGLGSAAALFYSLAPPQILSNSVTVQLYTLCSQILSSSVTVQLYTLCSQILSSSVTVQLYTLCSGGSSDGYCSAHPAEIRHSSRRSTAAMGAGAPTLWCPRLQRFTETHCASHIDFGFQRDLLADYPYFSVHVCCIRKLILCSSNE